MNTHKYIDGKCAPECGGGHPVAKATVWRRLARFVKWRKRGWA